MGRKERKLITINSIRSVKHTEIWTRVACVKHLHKLHESKFPLVSLSTLSVYAVWFFSAHVIGVRGSFDGRAPGGRLSSAALAPPDGACRAARPKPATLLHMQCVLGIVHLSCALGYGEAGEGG